MRDPTCKGKWTPAMRNYVVLTNRERIGGGEGIRLQNFLCFYSVCRGGGEGLAYNCRSGGLNIMLVTGSKEPKKKKNFACNQFFDDGDAIFFLFCLLSFSGLSFDLSKLKRL
jgi:hypothetical protein